MAASKIIVVCSIDLGTTYSGYAFSFKADYERDPQNVSMNSWKGGKTLSEKAPTAVLLDPKQAFHSFGYEAENKYTELAETDDHHNWYYFSRFKMMLHKQKDLKREAKIETQDGKVCKAKKIFTFSIKYLKEHMEEAMKIRGLDIRADEMAWVLTLPAIWTDSAKQFMREAATDAGIPGKQLTLALEPESASIFCQKIPSNKFVDQVTSVSTLIEPGKRYVVLDLGGGTADITVHKIGRFGDIHELRSASGGAWGGTRVDEEFRQFIVSIVGQAVWTKFKHKQMYDYLDMFREFETKKKTISTDTSKNIVVRIPVSLTDILKKKSNTTIQKALDKAGYKDKAENKGDKLFINAELFKSFFSSVVDSIISHLKEIFEDPTSEDPPLVLMVGGFSDSKFVQERLKAAFPTKKFVVPMDAGLAVLKGSVMFGFQPEVIRTRVCQKTYGISFHKPYIPGVHPESKRTVIDGDVLCKKCFLKFVTVGEKLEVGDKREHSFIDTFHSNERKKITEECHIYTSPRPDPTYTDELKCEKLGTIFIYPPEGGWPPEMHGRVVMEFGRTEFRVTVYDETNIREFKSSFDFLT
ncbi:hypothetical protein CHS0354_042027 [Potamilus streckersoni]|uniref:Heat shock 70 kDa protein 12B n=1 Tax=Potamilus streckersoni TaxID=2493646 RepID=A0AAE0W8V6_9BIVA|nr:hypothetical protein CHS0354_042027 [Potamilus streckersoni]